MDYSVRIEELIGQMSVLEKAILCSGKKFWFTRGLKKYGIQPYMVSDGPHGLRKQKDNADNLGINDSAKATCFPTAVTMASSWDTALVRSVGEKIAEEALEEHLGIVLGPGVNIKRNPLCGRNFEYYSEDPLLAGKMGAAFIQGCQSKGIGTSLKHYAVNNQENDRLRIDAVVDERALREIYLTPFELAVKEGKPYTVMCAYNAVNGEFCGQNDYLLNTILRKEWGFEGYVMSDWGAVFDRVKGLKAGLELEMPGGSGQSIFEIVDAVKDGSLDIEVLNTAVRRLLNINFAVTDALKESYKYDRDEHHEYARKVAGECAVLLKNEGDALPYNKSDKLIVIGALAKKPRFQGSGSSLINPNKVDNVLEILDREGINYTYADGYDANADTVDQKYIDEAIAAAGGEGKVTVFIGLTWLYESEGFDRDHINLPANQDALLQALTALNKDITVVLYGGAPVQMKWLPDVKAVLNMYLAGQASGAAAVDIIFGDVNPSGKLAETYPLQLEDTPSYSYFPMGAKTVEYRESIFVGYRYYDKAKKEVLFPFGHGLSYTQFDYSNVRLSAPEIADADTATVTFDITNIGKRDGKEAYGVYVRHLNSQVFKADKELKGFGKVLVKAGETVTVSVNLDKRAFAYYNIYERDFVVEGGNYEILAGGSSAVLPLKAALKIKGRKINSPYAPMLTADYSTLAGTPLVVSDKQFEEVLKQPIPCSTLSIKPMHRNCTVNDSRAVWLGRLIYKGATVGAGKLSKSDDPENAKVMTNFMVRMLVHTTFKSLSTTSGGIFSLRSLDGLVMMLNGKLFRGTGRLIGGFIRNAAKLRKIKKAENGKAK